MENDGATLVDMTRVSLENDYLSRARIHLSRVAKEFRGIEKKCTSGLTVFGITLLPPVKPSSEDLRAIERIRQEAQVISNYCNYPQARGLNSRTVLLRLDIERFYRHYGIGR